MQGKPFLESQDKDGDDDNEQVKKKLKVSGADPLILFLVTQKRKKGKANRKFERSTKSLLKGTMEFEFRIQNPKLHYKQRHEGVNNLLDEHEVSSKGKKGFETRFTQIINTMFTS